MITFPRLFFSIGIAALIASPARAEVTAPQAWNSWLDQMIDAGYDVDFDAETSGEILSVNNLTLTRSTEGSDLISVELPPIGYRERGDGTVDVHIPDGAPLIFNFKNDLSVKFRQQLSGFSYVIGGSPGALTHTLIAEDISYSLTELIDGGQPAEDAKVNIGLGAVDIYVTSNSATFQSLSSNASIGKISYDINLKNTGMDGGVFTLLGDLSGLHYNIDLTIPKNMESGDLDKIMDAGFAVRGSARFGDVNAAISIVDGNETVKTSITSDSGSATITAIPNANGLLAFAQNLALGSIMVDVQVVEGNDNIDLNATMADLSGALELAFPDSFDPDQMPAALNAGFTFNTTLKHGPINGTFSSLQGDEKGVGNLEAESGDVFLTFDRQTMHYGGNSGSMKVSVETTELPIGPVEYSFASYAFDFLMPINVSTDPEDFTFQFSLVDLWINDSLWALFDPTAKLSREPATLVLDITGAGNWLVDIMDNGLDQDNGGAPKGELHALMLKALRLNAAGTELTGSGDFTFNNDDLTSYDGMPAPTGTLDLKLTGGNSLIDNLVTMGLLPEEQAMGVRMGLGLFTVAGEGNDTLISHIETTGDGKVLANGQRLK